MKQQIYELYDIIKSKVDPLDIRNKSEKTRALMALGVVSLFWGTTWFASKKGVAYISGIQMAGLRQLIGGSVYLIFFTIKGYGLPTKKHFIQLIWMSFLMFVISNGFTTWSMEYIPSGLGAVIGATSPIWIALFSALFFKGARFNLVTILGLLMGFGGIMIIFSDYMEAMLESKFTFGIILGVIAAITWALGSLYTARHAESGNPYYSMGWQMFLSGIILTITAKTTGQYTDIDKINPVVWYSISYLVITGSVISFAAFIYMLKRLPAAQSSIYAYINPIVAVILGSFLNNERLSTIIIAGTCVTLIGVYMVNMGFRKNSNTN
ncbi:MAG: DMT family transporter [Chitinophagaceae bacterium]